MNWKLNDTEALTNYISIKKRRYFLQLNIRYFHHIQICILDNMKKIIKHSTDNLHSETCCHALLHQQCDMNVSSMIQPSSLWAEDAVRYNVHMALDTRAVNVTSGIQDFGISCTLVMGMIHICTKPFTWSHVSWHFTAKHFNKLYDCQVEVMFYSIYLMRFVKYNSDTRVDKPYSSKQINTSE